MSDQKYYAPYESASEEESDVSSESGESHVSLDSSESGFSDSAARRLDDPRYAIIAAAGKNFNTVNEQLAFSKGNMGSAYSNELVNPAFPKSVAESPLYINPKKQIVSSLFSFKSQDRDINVYPFSTSFSLKTPRIYKNVSQIQLVQISIQNPLNNVPDVSSVINIISNYFDKITDLSDCKQCLENFASFTGGGFSELGRTNPILPSQVLVHGFEVRSGSYDPESLASELNQQTNKTPPFTTVSYAEHKRLFQSTKQVDHLFNEPGRYYFNTLSNTFFTTNNKADIINLYLPDLTLVDSQQPSDQETFVAYFYPVLKEAFMTPFDFKFLDLSGYSESNAKHQVLNQYQGLNSPFYYMLCQLNHVYLRTLRRSYTFEYNPINDYQWDYSPLTKKISVVHTDLHKSIQADIAKRYTYDKQQQLAIANVSPLQIRQQLQTEAIVADLTNQIAASLVQLGVPYGLFASSYLYQPSNLIQTDVSANLPSLYVSSTDEVFLDIATGTLSSTVVGTPVGSGTFGINSISTIVGDTTTPIGSPTYLSHLAAANTAAQLSRAGSSAIPGYPGVPVSAVDFSSLYSTFLSYQSTNIGLSAAITAATVASISSTTGYITSRYRTVFPPSILNANLPGSVGTGGTTWYAGLHTIKPSTPFDAYGSIATDTPLFKVGPHQEQLPANSCCSFVNAYLTNLYGCLPVNYYVNSVFYKMGFGFQNFLSFYSTSGLTDATQNGNIYIQINPEQSMNLMDVASRQNTNVSNETTGEHKTVLGKILTEGTGASVSAQTVIQIPARYDPPLANIDHFSMNLLLDDLTPLARLFPFQIPGTDWNGIFQIDEEVHTLDRATDLTSVPTVKWDNLLRPF